MECAWSITFFFQYINTMRGEMTIGDRRKCFFFMFLMRGKMKLGSCGVINGRWTQRSSLTFSLTFLSSDVLKQSQPHPLSFCPLRFARSSLISQISTSGLFDLLMETPNLVSWLFSVACLCSGFCIWPQTFQSWILTGGYWFKKI